MLAVQLVGSEDILADVIEMADPLTPDSKAEAIDLCREYANYAAGIFDETLESDAEDLAVLSSHTEAIFPGVLVTDITQARQPETASTIRVACVHYAYEIEEADG